MCLLYDAKITEQLKKQLKQGRKRFWKIYDYKQLNGCLCSIFYNQNSKTGKIKPIEVTKAGFVISDRTDSNISSHELTKKQVYKGIHVYTSFKKARLAKFASEVVIPVEVRLEDFVAGGFGDEAVFMKVKIPQEIIKKYNVKIGNI